MRPFLTIPPLSAVVLTLAAAGTQPAQASDASEACRGGLPALALLEGRDYAVNAYLADCGPGSARKALVVPDGAAATGDGVTCRLAGESFDLTGDAVVADGIRAARGDTVRCTDGRSFKLRTGDGAPLPGGTTCEVSDETLSGSFALLDEDEVTVTMQTMLVDCGASGSALIVPRGATTTVDPVIEGVQLRCPTERFSIRNEAEARRAGGQLVVVADDQITDCKATTRGRDRQTANFDLTLEVAEPVTCNVPGGSCTAFITSTVQKGDFGGLAVADAVCQERAEAAGLPEGTYLAWLSDSNDSPSTRFTQATVPYVLVNGTQIADNWTDLTDGTIDSALNRNENGDNVSNSNNAHRRARTGTRANGTPHGRRCSDWTATTGDGIWGSALNTNYQWSGASGGSSISSSCGDNQAFFCFQQ
jgi:hypothetical protein